MHEESLGKMKHHPFNIDFDFFPLWEKERNQIFCLLLLRRQISIRRKWHLCVSEIITAAARKTINYSWNVERLRYPIVEYSTCWLAPYTYVQQALFVKGLKSSAFDGFLIRVFVRSPRRQKQQQWTDGRTDNVYNCWPKKKARRNNATLP